MSTTPSTNTILLNRFQYCHVLDRNTGVITLHEGQGAKGKRIQLESHEELVGTWDKVRVPDGSYAVVLNPFDAARSDIAIGEREVRPGPREFALHPGEVIESGKVLAEHVLADDDALLLRAERDAPHPLAGTSTAHPANAILRAGEEFLLTGPRRFIPHKDVRIKEHRKRISLAAAEGKYVQNDDTGAVRLVRGPNDFFLAHNESLWDKRLTHEELEALGYTAQDVDSDSRVLAAEPQERASASDAVVLDLEDNEAISVFDGANVRVEFGPQTIFLEPHEHPRVLYISGGVPVRPNVLRLAKLKLGPDFIRDKLTVRTKDNATLVLDVNYRWRFEVDRAKPEEARKLFALKDFVGFVAQTLSSEIREEAAKHDFEAFHAKAAELVKQAVFGAAGKRVFDENLLIVFGVDVEAITPEDPEIKQKLADAIKTNVDIYTKRVQEIATLESERRVIEGRAKNEAARKDLIEQEIANGRRKEVADAETAKEAARVRAEGEAAAATIRTTGEREAEVERLKAVAAELATDGGRAYIELERARILRATDKVIVPTDSKLVLGVNGTVLDE
ncbi:hypothetical protein HY635_04230 [Candidatus Uhrbacteria bacterium]|nr:hypothetical protein [Candidatus Uhrbacteria bacterium]